MQGGEFGGSGSFSTLQGGREFGGVGSGIPRCRVSGVGRYPGAMPDHRMPFGLVRQIRRRVGKWGRVASHRSVELRLYLKCLWIAFRRDE